MATKTTTVSVPEALTDVLDKDEIRNHVRETEFAAVAGGIDATTSEGLIALTNAMNWLDARVTEIFQANRDAEKVRKVAEVEAQNAASQSKESFKTVARDAMVTLLSGVGREAFAELGEHGLHAVITAAHVEGSEIPQITVGFSGANVKTSSESNGKRGRVPQYESITIHRKNLDGSAIDSVTFDGFREASQAFVGLNAKWTDSPALSRANLDKRLAVYGWTADYVANPNYKTKESA